MTSANHPSLRALRLRAETVDERVCTASRFANALGIPLEQLEERAHELRGVVEARRVGETYVVCVRRPDGAWPSSEQIEKVVARVRSRKPKDVGRKRSGRAKAEERKAA